MRRKIRSPKDHIHQYVLRPYGKKGRKVYACALPDCSHFQIEKKLLIGKQSLCNQCLQPFILTRSVMENNGVRPRCPECREKRRLGGKRIEKKQEEVKTEDIFDSALENLWKGLDL